MTNILSKLNIFANQVTVTVTTTTDVCLSDVLLCALCLHLLLNLLPLLLPLHTHRPVLTNHPNTEVYRSVGELRRDDGQDRQTYEGSQHVESSPESQCYY